MTVVGLLSSTSMIVRQEVRCRVRGFATAMILMACGLASSDCSTNNIDGPPDGCVQMLVAAFYGTIEDLSGRPLVPDAVEARTEGVVRWGECPVDIEEDTGIVSYKCWEWKPPQTIEELPIQTYQLRIEVADDVSTWDVEVERADNCHVNGRRFDVVLPSPQDDGNGRD